MTFSIITPSFQQLDQLGLCMASVRDQPSASQALSVEHVVQDGGSADFPLFLSKYPVQENPAGDYQIRFYSESDRGMYDAINKGMDRSTGEILAYLNCDEQYLPGTLATVGDYFRDHPQVDILFGDVLLVRPSGEILSYRRVVPPGRWHTRLCHLGVWSCAMFFRRRVWESGLRFPAETRAIGDAVFVDRVLEKGMTVATLRQPLATFALDEGNLGQGPEALAEARLWRNSWGCKGRVMRPVLKVLHWLEKLRAGAYADRVVDYAVYTPDRSGTRTLFPARVASWRWKGSHG